VGGGGGGGWCRGWTTVCVGVGWEEDQDNSRMVIGGGNVRKRGSGRLLLLIGDKREEV